MKSPYTQEEMFLIEETITLQKDGKEFDVVVTKYKCPETGDTFEDETLAQLNYEKMMKESRKL